MRRPQLSLPKTSSNRTFCSIGLHAACRDFFSGRARSCSDRPMSCPPNLRSYCSKDTPSSCGNFALVDMAKMMQALCCDGDAVPVECDHTSSLRSLDAIPLESLTLCTIYVRYCCMTISFRAESKELADAWQKEIAEVVRKRAQL